MSDIPWYNTATFHHATGIVPGSYFNSMRYSMVLRWSVISVNLTTSAPGTGARVHVYTVYSSMGITWTLLGLTLHGRDQQHPTSPSVTSISVINPWQRNISPFLASFWKRQTHHVITCTPSMLPRYLGTEYTCTCTLPVLAM